MRSPRRQSRKEEISHIKIDNKSITKTEQKTEQMHNKGITNTEPKHNREMVQKINTEPNTEQIHNQHITEIEYFELVGNEKKIVDEVFRLCESINELVSPPITINALSKVLSLEAKSPMKARKQIQTSIKRVSSSCRKTYPNLVILS